MRRRSMRLSKATKKEPIALATARAGPVDDGSKSNVSARSDSSAENNVSMTFRAKIPTTIGTAKTGNNVMWPQTNDLCYAIKLHHSPSISRNNRRNSILAAEKTASVRRPGSSFRIEAHVGRVPALSVSGHTVQKGDARLGCFTLTTSQLVKGFAVNRTETKVNPPPSIPQVAKSGAQT